jgi:hypothetical protein
MNAPQPHRGVPFLLLSIAVSYLAACDAHAALSLQLQLIHDDSGHVFTCSPNLTTDGAPPDGTPGTLLGTLTIRQQVIASPPVPLVIFSTRITGPNLVFDFLTVSNANYTVWSSTNLAAANWVSYTKVAGGGYVHSVTVPTSNTVPAFFRLSSP